MSDECFPNQFLQPKIISSNVHRKTQEAPKDWKKHTTKKPSRNEAITDSLSLHNNDTYNTSQQKQNLFFSMCHQHGIPFLTKLKIFLMIVRHQLPSARWSCFETTYKVREFVYVCSWWVRVRRICGLELLERRLSVEEWLRFCREGEKIWFRVAKRIEEMEIEYAHDLGTTE